MNDIFSLGASPAAVRHCWSEVELAESALSCDAPVELFDADASRLHETRSTKQPAPACISSTTGGIHEWKVAENEL